jgi:hypothetical protein
MPQKITSSILQDVTRAEASREWYHIVLGRPIPGYAPELAPHYACRGIKQLWIQTR